MNSSLSKQLQSLKQSDEFVSQVEHHKRMIRLGEKVFGRRNDFDLTQEELAQKVGTTQRLISQIENASYAPRQGIGEGYYDKLAKALEIDRDYLFSDKIDRTTFELFSYLSEKLGTLDIMQFMKLPYFIDLESVKIFHNQVTNFEYIRYEYGPFDSKIYTYKGIGNNGVNVKYTYLEPYLELIDHVLKNLPTKSGNKLKKLSYETAPMKALGATLGGNEHMRKRLDLTLV